LGCGFVQHGGILSYLNYSDEISHFVRDDKQRKRRDDRQKG
jgi:hypothetical protein